MGELNRHLLRGLTPDQLRQRAQDARHRARALAIDASQQLRQASDLVAEASGLEALADIAAQGRPPTSQAGAPPAGQFPGRTIGRGLLTPKKAL